MTKPLLLSLVTATLLSTNLDAMSMLERFEAMEREMNSLKQEIAQLKSQQSKSITKRSKAVDEADEDDEEEELASNEADDEGEEGDVDEEESEIAAGTAVAMAASDDDEDDEDRDGEDSDEDDDEEGDVDEDDIETDEERISELEEAVSELTRNTSGSHLKFNIDYRFAIENMSYGMAKGGDAENDAFMTNRLWINMGYKATNNLSFKGQLAYNKAFGARSSDGNDNMETFDWIANENAYDDEIRVRSAYLLWQDQEFFGLDIPWTFSVGRRPSTGGHLANLREDDSPNSPLAHGINVEFDGASSKFTLYKPWKTSIKLCAGRGMSNAKGKFTQSGTPYAEDDNKDTAIDLIGLIFVPYKDHQYSLNMMYYYATNLIDSEMSMASGAPIPTGDFEDVGNMHSATANITVNGIGNEWSDFLDETTFFVSGAVSITDPNGGKNSMGQENGMLGSDDSETGYSYWLGTQFPSLMTEDGRWGLEFNHGSQYWRAITYGEDTNIGSKVAARGDAYEAYMTEYLVEDILSIQLRYTYIDYEYSGSNGFFGNVSGTPEKISKGMRNAENTVDNATDIRLYLRYRY